MSELQGKYFTGGGAPPVLHRTRNKMLASTENQDVNITIKAVTRYRDTSADVPRSIPENLAKDDLHTTKRRGRREG